MLVHCKTPRGVLYLSGFQIWGKETGRDPCDIPFELYNTCKDALQDGTYREKTLQRLFSKPFPEVAFTYSELRYLPDQTLDLLGPLMVDKYNTEWSHKKKIDQIKLSIVAVSPL